MYYIRKLINWLYGEHRVHVWSRWYEQRCACNDPLKPKNPKRRRYCEACGRVEQTDTINGTTVVKKGDIED
jgi:hypothetical protein